MVKLKKKIYARMIRFLIAFFGIIIVYAIIGLLPGLEVSRYTYYSVQLPESFDGFKIVQLSDYHCKEFGKNNQKLLDKIDDLEPDIIVLTGDFIDGYHDSAQNAISLVTELSKKYTIYKVNGNHEKDSKRFYAAYEEACGKLGVHSLNNSSTSIVHEDGQINLHGLDWYDMNDTEYKWWETIVNSVAPSDGEIDILLNHNALQFPVLAEYGYELILSGHLHGGVIRLPIVGGVLSTDHGFGTEYEAGVYQIRNSTLISNRGLGDTNPAIPRFWNRSEIVLITLRKE